MTTPHLTVVPIEREPDSEIVRCIKQFEDMARQGEVVSVAVVVVRRDGDPASAYVLGPDAFKLMGATYQLLRRVSSNVDPDLP